MRLWTYRRRFRVDGRAVEVTIASGLSGLTSTMSVDGAVVAGDGTPAYGPESTRNHRLETVLAEGRRLEVEAGYVNWVSIGVAARLDGAPIYESHPGKAIAYPRSMRGMAESSADPGEHWKRNGPSLIVDVVLGLVFFAVAKVFGLTEAAVTGAVAGLGLIVVQRFVKVDIVGGLALFGVVTLLLSAGYALVFQDEDAVKMRTTVVGLIVAALFVADGLAGGRWLGRGLARYLPYEDVRLNRLALGLGASGAVMALLNVVVVRAVSTDVWLLYTTFGDVVIAMGLFLLVLKYARPQAPAAAA